MIPEWLWRLLDWPHIRDAVLFVLSLWGAGLSTYNLWAAKRKDGRYLKVSFRTVMQTFTDGNLGEPYAQIEVVNVGHRPVTVSLISFERVDGGRIFATAELGIVGISNTKLPVTLSDGETAHWLMSYQDIGRGLLHHGNGAIEKLTPVCEDTARNVYRGEPWEVNPEQLARAAAW
jgi:hypothetical protein